MTHPRGWDKIEGNDPATAEQLRLAAWDQCAKSAGPSLVRLLRHSLAKAEEAQKQAQLEILELTAQIANLERKLAK
jgi:hypothetical protein